MRIKNTFKIAISGLRANKLRSLLTILGIVIGITAIILVISVTQGAQNLILNEIKSMGGDIVVIRPGREPKGPTDMAEMLSNSLKESDVDALKKKENVPDLVDLVPAVIVPGGVSGAGETYNRAMVIGWSAEWLSEMYDIYPAEGELFDEEAIKQRAKVAVIGADVKKELFWLSEAVGEKVKIKDQNFRVIGVLPPRGQVSMFNFDELVIIPYSTAQKDILGIDYFQEVLAKAKSEAVVPRMVQDIERTLREQHNIDDPKKDDFFTMTQNEIAETVGTITGVMALLLTSVAAISLVVGGIGIMNIMLVSVTERTREIGLRKAVGARNRDILKQFLFEAVILTAVGGLVGIILGVVLSFAVSIILGRVLSVAWSFSFPVAGILLGLAVSGVVGLIFGLYPARQASLKDPIDALRHE